MRRLFIGISVIAFGLVGCGDDGGGAGGGGSSDDDGGELDQGFTECGTQTCQPGTHCLNGACVPGCVSNTNCAEGEDCDVDAVSGDGTCQDGATGEGGSDPTGGHTSDCDGFAAYAQECGLAASFAEAIRQSCDGASAQEKQGMIACAASESCDEFMSCSGAECFADDQCTSGDCIDPNEAAAGQFFVCAP